ncbi:MAG: hypothetical protein SWH61_06785 [Thermodesulfobacteriota bacterium]|nr:hypothetical protein [Thermodesulfobacteriota bacterium]
MTQRKDDDWLVFFGGRIPLKKRDQSMIIYGIFFGVIGAVTAIVFWGKNHKFMTVIVIAVFIIVGMFLGSKNISSKK